MKKVNGISLIVLVITIIVMIIIAGAIILSLSNGNVISKAKEAKAKSNVATMIEKANDAYREALIANGGIAPTDVQVTAAYASANGSAPTDYTISATGTLTYTGSDVTIIAAATAIGVTIPPTLPPVPAGFTISQVTGESTVADGLVIYQTLTPVTDATAATDRTTLNQFVWVPVDGTAVPYARWYTSVWTESGITEDTLPSGVPSEIDQITKYKGFYIARYEASGTTVVSKKGKIASGGTIYATFKTRAEAMYNTSSLKSGLVTGTQWDTVMKWIQNSGISVTDSRTWGNTAYPLTPADNNEDYGYKTTTGYSEYWKAKNIYDLSGNMFEWTSQKYGTFMAYRGGSYMDNAAADRSPAISRGGSTPDVNYIPWLGYRVVLYML